MLCLMISFLQNHGELVRLLISSPCVLFCNAATLRLDGGIGTCIDLFMYLVENFIGNQTSSSFPNNSKREVFQMKKGRKLSQPLRDTGRHKRKFHTLVKKCNTRKDMNS